MVSLSKMIPTFVEDLTRELKAGGLRGVQVSKAVMVAVKAIEAAEDLIDICAEIERSGKTEVAGELWAMHIASLISLFPILEREKYLKIILKLARGMDGNQP